ncbi:major facilitator superfamily domain-containing protein [Xylariaceae sp. FL1019]|nr:major facilitator superfamily domain-containing protein [Xylariaceae sp. FL1019]
MASSLQTDDNEARIESSEHEEASDNSPLLQPRPGPRADMKSSRTLLIAGPALTFVSTVDLSYFAANYSRRIGWYARPPTTYEWFDEATADEMHQIGNASWLVTAYLITKSTFQPMYAHLSQHKGHKAGLIAAASAMNTGLLLCPLSQTIWQLPISRAVVGVGAAGLELLVLVIINEQVDLYSLPLWRSIITAVSTLASFLGPSAGAALRTVPGFAREVFGVEFFLNAVGVIGIILTLRTSSPDDSRGPRTRMDYTGAGLLLLVVGTPLVILNLGGQILSWADPIRITLYAIWPALFSLFFGSQLGHSGYTLIPLQFLRNKSVIAMIACGLPAWLSWDQLKYGLGQNVEARSLRSQLLLRVAAFVNVLTYVCFAAGWIHPEGPSFAPFLILIGLNVGILDSCWLVAIFAQASPKDQPALYAFIDLGPADTGNLGIAIALASTNAMIRSNLKQSLTMYPDKEEITRKSLESFSAIREFPREIRDIVLNTFVSSSEKAFAISASVLIVSVIAAFHIPEIEHLPEDHV